MKNNIILTAILILFVSSCTTIPKYMSKENYKALEDGLYAHMETTKGNMLIKFYEKQAPMTVANFIGLAEGVKSNKAKAEGVPFYDGIIFHRVIKDFMIQCGDPQGTGAGGPGYSFEDEFDEDLIHDKKGVLSMANSGPNTNGSQFFITEVPTPWLDGKHSIFGQVVDGLEVIDTIANVKKGAQDKPIEPIKIEKVEILRKGDEYKNYDAVKSFDSAKANHAARIAEIKRKKEEEKKQAAARLKDLAAKAKTAENGSQYYIFEQGTGAKPVNGDSIKVHYTLRLANGEKIDSSLDRNQPLDIRVGEGGLIQGWLDALTMFERGTKVLLIIPPSLGYGDRPMGGVIPANSTLYFDMEFLND